MILLLTKPERKITVFNLQKIVTALICRSTNFNTGHCNVNIEQVLTISPNSAISNHVFYVNCFSGHKICLKSDFVILFLSVTVDE